jgi:heptosyltransferase II
MAAHPPWNSILPGGRILVRGVNWLGDAVMSTPALQRLREAHPSAHIALLTPQKLAALWEHYPHVDEVIAFSPRDTVFQVGRRLRSGNYQLGLLFPNSPRSALELRLARIPERIGYARLGRGFLLSRALPPPVEEVIMRKRTAREIRELIAGIRRVPHGFPARSHHIYHYLQLVAAAGADPAPVSPNLFVSADEASRVLERFDIPEDERPLIGLNPGAEYGPAKRWPAERFAGVAAALIRLANVRLVLLGGAADRELVSDIFNRIVTQRKRSEAPAIWNLAGQTTLRELCAVFRGCAGVLTNDTGPMHVAAAVGTPVVAPFGSTSPELTGPGLPGEGKHRLLKSNAPCSPCYLRECPIDFRCMREIEVNAVIEAVMQILR